MISDSYDLGIVKQGDHYNEGELINKLFQEPVPEIALLLQGVDLEVSFNGDGSAFINEGHYPTVETGENCIATETIPAITDDFEYNEETAQNYHIPYNDIFGNESLLITVTFLQISPRSFPANNGSLITESRLACKVA